MGDFDGEYEVSFQIKFSGNNDQQPTVRTGTYIIGSDEVDTKEEAEQSLEDFYSNQGEDCLSTLDLDGLDVHNLGDTELEILETTLIPSRFMGKDWERTEPLTVEEETDLFVKNKGDGGF